MATKIIVSYDGTNNEDDAIAFGRILARAGAEVSLAYVQHTPPGADGAGALGQQEAEGLLARGAQLFGSPVQTHVVTDRSTPEGLRTLAQSIGAQAILFCSDSHTAAGHVGIGNSAQRLIDGGPVAVGIAPAGLARRGDVQVQRVGTTGAHDDLGIDTTARSLAGAFGATVTRVADGGADLLLLGSRPEADPGRVSISASVQNLIEISNAPVLVLPRGASIPFGAPVAV